MLNGEPFYRECCFVRQMIGGEDRWPEVRWAPPGGLRVSFPDQLNTPIAPLLSPGQRQSLRCCIIR